MERKFVSEHANQAQVIAHGLNISQDIACGKLVFSELLANQLSSVGEPFILVKEDISPEDVDVIKKSQGFLLTERKSIMYSLILSKTLRKSSILLYNSQIDRDNNVLKVENKIYPEGTVVSLNGLTGEVYLGAIKQVHTLGFDDLVKEDLRKRTNKVYSKVS